MENNHKKYYLPALLLGVMFVLMIASSWNDTATFDEQAHIPAGYANLYLQDYRLNPEHPPLIKALAAAGLLFEKMNFPVNTAAWQTEVNGQWDQGRAFLYQAGNDADSILRRMRLPIMLLAIALGWLLWLWVYRHFGHRVAALTLFLYAFSPTFIAHSRFVTTDLGASFAFFIAIVAFVKFLGEPSRKNIILAGLAFGVAELIKFSLILLFPIYGILLISWAFSKVQFDAKERWRIFLGLLGKTVMVGVVGVLLIWAVYGFFVWNYPAERQYADTASILSTSPLGPLVTFDLALTKNKILRPLGEYVLGVLMVLQRTGGGNTTYYWGELSAAGWRSYFPVLYAVKEPLAFHILTLIAVVFGISKIRKASRESREKYLARMALWTRDHFIEFSAFVFIAVYWLASVSSTLNLGIRHVLPTFPFIYLLVSREIIAWLRPWRGGQVQSWWEWFKKIWQMYVVSLPRYVFLWVMIAWQAVSVAAVLPSFLSYYNILGGGAGEGYAIAVDSNYDWGQDLKRLKFFVEQNGIDKIAVDYFGGGNPQYYLGGKFEPWWSARGYPSSGGWLAVSVSTQMGAYATPAHGYSRKPEDGYEWLKPYRPVTRAGKSIFIYQLPEKSQFAR